MGYFEFSESALKSGPRALPRLGSLNELQGQQVALTAEPAALDWIVSKA